MGEDFKHNGNLITNIISPTFTIGISDYFNISNPIINTSKVLDKTKILIPLRRKRVHKLLGPLVIKNENLKLYNSKSSLINLSGFLRIKFAPVFFT